MIIWRFIILLKSNIYVYDKEKREFEKKYPQLKYKHDICYYNNDVGYYYFDIEADTCSIAEFLFKNSTDTCAFMCDDRIEKITIVPMFKEKTILINEN